MRKAFNRREVFVQLMVPLVVIFCLSGVSSGQGIGIAPEVEIDKDGNVTVKWESEDDCSAASVSFGLAFEEDPFGLPYYRLRVAAEGSARSFTARVPLKDVERMAKGMTLNGVVFYRATCFDSGSQGWLDSGDCVFRYIGREGSYRKGVAIVEGPIVADITSSSVLIRWVTDMPSAGRVAIQNARTSVEASSLRSPPGMTSGFPTEVTLESLKPSTTYSYWVETWARSDDIFRTRSYRFRTAPAPGSEEKFSFAVFCDTRTNDYSPIAVQALNGVNADVLRQLAVSLYRKGARFAVVPGDLIWGITTDPRKAELEFTSWKKTVGPITRYIPFYTGIGNHDAEVFDVRILGEKIRLWQKGHDSAEEIFEREMTNPTNGPSLPEGSDHPTYSENVYSFDYGNSHFVMLNNNYKSLAFFPGEREKGKIVGPQLEWLREDLRSATARGQENIFVFFHEPAFPNGGHLMDSMYHAGDKAYMARRDEFWRLLCQHKVTAVFSGHEHNYSRTLIDEKVDESFSWPIWQIITGGGGAPFHPQEQTPWSQSVKAFSPRHHCCLVNIAGQKVRIRVFDLAGNVIDTAVLK